MTHATSVNRFVIAGTCAIEEGLSIVAGAGTEFTLLSGASGQNSY